MRFTIRALALVLALLVGPSHAQMTTLGAGGTKVAAGAFTPAQLSGLIGWWKADAGVYSDTGCSTPATNTGVVACWADQSGHGHNFLQATTANQPTYSTNALNGLPVLVGGTTPYMSIASFALGGNTVSAYIVFNNGGTAASARVFDYGSTNDYDPGGFIAAYVPASDNPTAFQNSAQSGVINSAYSNAWVQTSSWCDGSTVNIVVGQGGTYAAGPATADTPTFGATGTLNIFASNGGTANLASGKIAEIVITSNESATDRTNMQTYLHNKWGI